MAWKVDYKCHKLYVSGNMVSNCFTSDLSLHRCPLHLVLFKQSHYGSLFYSGVALLRVFSIYTKELLLAWLVLGEIYNHQNIDHI